MLYLVCVIIGMEFRHQGDLGSCKILTDETYIGVFGWSKISKRRNDPIREENVLTRTTECVA